MKSNFPKELITDKGRRKPKQLKNIIKEYPIFWDDVLKNTNPNLDDKTRYDLYWYGLYDYKNCLNSKCDNKVIKNITSDFCSTKCMYDSGIVKDKIEKTNIKKYGSKSSLGNQEIRKKGIATNLKKYGVENGGWSEESQKKIKETCNMLYGTDTPIDANREKIVYRFQEKYNSNTPFASLDVQNKAKNTLQEKYGVSNIFQIDEYRNKNKSIKTKNEKYNLDILTDKDNIINILKMYGWKKVADYIGYNTNSHSPTYNKLKEYGISFYNKSNPELEIKEYIESLGFVVEHNNRKIIAPYELDLYISEKNIAIEFNGLYWHSSDHKDKDPKYMNIHINKTELCEQKGIQLLHIFENEWENKKDIWKSVISAKLGMNKKIYARNCVLKDIQNNIANEFCNENHLQGKAQCSFSKGLYYNDELVMVATFSKTRYRKDNYLELIRLCTKKYLNVVGGSSKLIAYVDGEIISYANRRWSNGNVYKKMGGEFIGISKPCYWYIKGKTISHRSNYMKHKLKDKLENYDPNITEIENCYNNKLRRIWDCGNIIYKIK